MLRSSACSSRGDFGVKVLTSSDLAAKTAKLAAEIANGRLVMLRSSAWARHLRDVHALRAQHLPVHVL
eukprot:12085109-Heterocapsa_arctica.AAC.1